MEKMINIERNIKTGSWTALIAPEGHFVGVGKEIDVDNNKGLYEAIRGLVERSNIEGALGTNKKQTIRFLNHSIL